MEKKEFRNGAERYDDIARRIKIFCSHHLNGKKDIITRATKYQYKGFNIRIYDDGITIANQNNTIELSVIETLGFDGQILLECNFSGNFLEDPSVDPFHEDFRVRYNFYDPDQSYVISRYQNLFGGQSFNSQESNLSSIIVKLLESSFDMKLLKKDITKIEDFKIKSAQEPDYNIKELEKLLYFSALYMDCIQNKDLDNKNTINKPEVLKSSVFLVLYTLCSPLEPNIINYISLFVQEKLKKLKQTGCDDILYIEKLEKILSFSRDFEESKYEDFLPDNIATIIQNEINIAQTKSEKNEKIKEFNTPYIENLKKLLTFLQEIDELAKIKNITEKKDVIPSTESFDSHSDR